MARVLLDASALLALMFDEEGAAAVASAVEGGAAMSAVNVGEIAARLHDDGWTPAEVAGGQAMRRVDEGLKLVLGL